MVKLEADASPEKRLFISLITRDIPLIAAFLDLIDNSINAAIESQSDRLLTAEDYFSVSRDMSISPRVEIHLDVTPQMVSIRDTASGISASVAREHVFKFGRATNESHERDRLSVYGIGLKRAMFKLGNKINIISDHREGGFQMDLDVSEWEKKADQPWTFTISSRKPTSGDKCGTTVTVSELYDDPSRRLGDGVFIGQLKDSISKTYAYYITKFVTIYVNGEKVEGMNFNIGSNYALENFVHGDVTCTVAAGIGNTDGGTYRDRSSGWFVFCNGRTVVSADKSPLTGWVGGGSQLPIFQPKHRPFLGIVFFVSRDAEQLPWTTTKASINEDSAIWQAAKRYMATVGRQIISFLDSRYTDDGTGVASAELREVAGSRVSVMAAATSNKRVFEPLKKPPPKTVKIQYAANISDIRKIEDYLKRPGMGGSEIGRYTFRYFLRNEVGEN